MVLVLAFLGALSASLVMLLVERRVVGLPMSRHSVCRCGRSLRLSEVIPLYGFVVSFGRSRCCATPIPLRYPLTEAATALAWALASRYSLLWGALGDALVLVLVALFTRLASTLDSRHGSKHS